MARVMDKCSLLETTKWPSRVFLGASRNTDKAHARSFLTRRTQLGCRRFLRAGGSSDGNDQQISVVSQKLARDRPANNKRRGQVEVEDLLKAADALMSQLGSADSVTSASRADEESGEGPSIMKLQCDVHGCTIVPVAPESAAIYGPSGSFIGSSGQAVAEANRPREFLLSEGDGWKLGYDKNPKMTNSYSSLLGSDSWSISMTQKEFIDFVQLLRKLQRSIATLQTCGEWGTASPNSRGESAANGNGSKNVTRALQSEATLELQTERVWVQARAPQKQLFHLTDIFQRGGFKKAKEAPAAAFHLRFIVTTPGQREVEGQFGPEVVKRLLEHLETYPPGLEEAEDDEPVQSRTQALAEYIG